MAKINKANIIKLVQSQQMRSDLPVIRTGDTITVHLKVLDGNKSRIQKITGTVLRVLLKNNLNKTFTIFKESTSGVTVKETFFYYSPLIVNIEVLKHGKVHKSYISYLPKLSGKKLHLKEK